MTTTPHWNVALDPDLDFVALVDEAALLKARDFDAFKADVRVKYRLEYSAGSRSFTEQVPGWRFGKITVHEHKSGDYYVVSSINGYSVTQYIGFRSPVKACRAGWVIGHCAEAVLDDQGNAAVPMNEQARLNLRAAIYLCKDEFSL